VISKLVRLLASNPWIYELSHRVARTHRLDPVLAAQTNGVSSGSRVLDVGGGAGSAQGLWSSDCLYVCLDIDEAMVRAFRPRRRRSVALQADAIRMPISDHSVDQVLCKFVCHHIPDESLGDLFQEARRVLKDSGRLLLVEPVWRSDSTVSRLLWRYDRGSHPRTPESLSASMSKHFEVHHTESLKTWHTYAFYVATPRQQTVGY
jgi:ubiquinone/menaquinone biosynthesis C-methylase UbiE